MSAAAVADPLGDVLDELLGAQEATPIWDALWDELGAGVQAAHLAVIEAKAAAQAAWGGAV